MQNTAYKVWKHVDFETDNDYLTHCCSSPKGLDFKTGLKARLFNKPTIVKGELVRMDYFASFDESTSTYSDLVVFVELVYTRDSNGLAIKRNKIVTRMFEDDTPCQDTKVMLKYYTTPKEKEQEVQKRRSNIIYDLKGRGYGTPFESVLTAFTDSIKNQIDLFILRGGPDLRNYIQDIDGTDANYAWIDMDLGGYTARQVFLDGLDI